MPQNNFSNNTFTKAPAPPWSYAQASQPYYSLISSDCDQPEAYSYFSTTVAQTVLQLTTGGLANSGNHLVRLVMTATDVYGNPLSPSTYALQGQNFTPTATNANVGELFLAEPNGSTNIIIPTVAGQNQYNFTLQAGDEALQSLTVVSNSATQIDATNWACVKSLTNDYVIVQANLSDTNAAALADAATTIQWTGGEPVPGNPLQREVSKTNSLETTVTASLGGSTTNLNVWVIWATISIQMSGTNPSPLSFANTNFVFPYPDEQLGIQYYDHDVIGVHPGDVIGITNDIAGKICAVATITPVGVHSIISNGWDFVQNKNTVVFSNGVVAIFNPPWTPDGPDGINVNKIIVPDIGDKLYTIDAPTLDLYRQNLNSAETYKNFYDYITWSNQICCDTNNFWHYQARWKTNLTPQFTLTDLGDGTTNIPLSSYYPPP